MMKKPVECLLVESIKKKPETHDYVETIQFRSDIQMMSQ